MLESSISLDTNIELAFAKSAFSKIDTGRIGCEKIPNFRVENEKDSLAKLPNR